MSERAMQRFNQKIFKQSTYWNNNSVQSKTNCVRYISYKWGRQMTFICRVTITDSLE